MPTSFKTGGRTPAGCAEARKLRANGDRNNTIAKARSMIRLASFDLCSLGTNISLLLPSPGSAGILACLLRSVSRRGKPAGKDACAPRGILPRRSRHQRPLNVAGVEPAGSAAAEPTAVAPIAEPAVGPAAEPVAGSASEH